MTITMTTTATPTRRYIFLLPFFSPPRPRPATSYDMSDLDRPNCELAIRISSPGRRRADIRQEALQPGRGPQLDRIRDFLLWEGDTRGADVQRNLVAFLLGPKN